MLKQNICYNTAKFTKNKRKMEYSEKIHPTIRANAVSAYLLIFVCVLFLFNKQNKYLNNDFVKSHTYWALGIHASFAWVYLIFVSSQVFGSLSLLGISLSQIIAKILFLFLLTTLLIWIYKAHKWMLFELPQVFWSWNKNDTKIVDLNGDGKFAEKDKLTILASYIPFIWYRWYGSYWKNTIIQNSTKLNLIISFLITNLYIFDHYNLGNIFVLFYTIFVVFVWINLFVRDTVISIKAEKIPDFTTLNAMRKVIFKYIKWYFSAESFTAFSELVKSQEKKEKTREKEDISTLKTKKKSKLPAFLVYIPYVNLIFLFIRNTELLFHIRNGITLTLLLLLWELWAFAWYYSADILFLFAFPIAFGMGYTKSNMLYKMPFVYDIYEASWKALGFLSFGTKKMNEMRKKETEVKLQVKK